MAWAFAYKKPNRRKNETAHKEQGGNHDKRSFPSSGKLAAYRAVAKEMMKHATNAGRENGRCLFKCKHTNFVNSEVVGILTQGAPTASSLSSHRILNAVGYPANDQCEAGVFCEVLTHCFASHGCNGPCIWTLE